MKILLVAHGFPPQNSGGTEIYACNLAKELAKRHSVSVFYRSCNLKAQEYVLSQNGISGLETFTVNNSFKGYNTFEDSYKNRAIAEKFGEVLDRIKPDIVHIQHLLYLGAEIIGEAKKRGIPIVFTLNDYWLLCPQGQLLAEDERVCSGMDVVKCSRCILHQLSIQRNIFNAYYFLQKKLPGFLFKFIKNIYLQYSKNTWLSNERTAELIKERGVYLKGICSEIDFFIAPSEFLRNKFIAWGIPQEKIILSPYGINTDNFKACGKPPCGNLRLGFIGNMLPAKGLHILIRAFNEIRDINAELKIYGRVGSYKGRLAGYLNYCKKISKDNKKIQFMGAFDNGKIADIFRGIDMLVVPSIWNENAPLVIQEAFLTKTPVIASRIGGIPELINEGTNGLLFEPGDINDLKERLENIINNPEILGRFKENIPRLKNIEENMRELEQIYYNLIRKDKLCALEPIYQNI